MRMPSYNDAYESPRSYSFILTGTRPFDWQDKYKCFDCFERTVRSQWHDRLESNNTDVRYRLMDDIGGPSVETITSSLRRALIDTARIVSLSNPSTKEATLKVIVLGSHEAIQAVQVEAIVKIEEDGTEQSFMGRPFDHVLDRYTDFVSPGTATSSNITVIIRCSQPGYAANPRYRPIEIEPNNPPTGIQAEIPAEASSTVTSRDTQTTKPEAS